MKVTKQFVLLALFGFLTLTTFAQKETVLTIGGEDVSLEEFENIFRKNNREEKVTKEALDEYMELFINFKLKVLEAKSQGRDQTKEFKKELANYRKQLARPYLTDSELLDELVKEAYDRKKVEVKAAHILVNCSPNASPEDTLKAYNKILKIRNRILNGEDFTKVAKETSEDPSVKQNGGELGYFSAFQMVYPFESAAYNTPVGGISEIVRTRFGYHILKVEDKRPARGELRVAHIMVKVKNPKDDTPEKRKIDDIYQQLLEGKDFADLALRYSDDSSTKRKGGELPWFGTGKMIPEFEDQAFALKNNGDFSKPFRTEHGWFIVKRLDYRPVSTFEKAKKELKTKVSRDSRSELTKQSFINKLKEEYGFKKNDKNIQALRALATNDLYAGKLDVDNAMRGKELFVLNNKKYTVNDFLTTLPKKPIRTKVKTPKIFFDEKMHEFINQSILDLEDSKLEEKHTAFRLLMNEYRDGILLFDLTDEMVWTKAVKDTLGLQAYYEAHKENYKEGERADVEIYSCKNKAIAKKVKKMLEQGKSSKDIIDVINKDSSLNVSLKKGLFTAEDKEILSKVPLKKGISDLIATDGMTAVLDIKSVLPARIKPLKETRGLVTADYQTQLEQEWIKELRKKYPFKVNKKVLYSLVD